MDLDALRGQVDLYACSRVCRFDRFGDRADAMTAGHVLDFEGKHVSPLSLLLTVKVSTLQRWECQARSAQAWEEVMGINFGLDLATMARFKLFAS